MWTWIFDAAAGGLCRTLNSVAGGFPSACLISAGRPALYAAAAIFLLLFVVATIAWQRYRASKAA